MILVLFELTTILLLIGASVYYTNTVGVPVIGHLRVNKLCNVFKIRKTVQERISLTGHQYQLAGQVMTS
jgi:hypothetical protein